MSIRSGRGSEESVPVAKGIDRCAGRLRRQGNCCVSRPGRSARLLRYNIQASMASNNPLILSFC